MNKWTSRTAILLVAWIIGGWIIADSVQSATQTAQIDLRDFNPLDQTEAQEAVAAQKFVGDIKIAEWLGPLAPIAISPFFAIALLSGVACYGQDWLPFENGLLAEGSPLANPTLFWVFVVLTVVTSIPRFSKVSKPFAQAADFLETYSVIITVIVIRVLTLKSGADETTEQVVLQAGFLQFTWESLLTIAMVINVIVINTVKFFFEFLIWITPIPTLDAIFEVSNKTLCAGLTALYTYSPLLATILNLVLFAICFLMFRWIHRRVVFYRSMLVDLLCGWVFPKRGEPQTRSLSVFPKSRLDSIPAKAKCVLEKSEAGWVVTQKRLLFSNRTVQLGFDEFEHPQIERGWFTNQIVFDEETRLVFSQRYRRNMKALAELIDVSLDGAESTSRDRKLEFA